jgi:ribonuclease HII
MVKLIAGVDEAGRGPLAGPVCAAAVILDTEIDGLRDSKKLSASRREVLYQQICTQSRCFGVGFASVEEIDTINILQASLLAMQRAVAQLSLAPDVVWVDGNQAPKLSFPVYTLVRGDQQMAEISAASIVAKVTRDRLMRELDVQYPGYDFVSNKGYGTRAHMLGLQQLGPSPIHRRSFAPVRACLKD